VGHPFPPEISCGQELAAGPPIQVVGVLGTGCCWRIFLGSSLLPAGYWNGVGLADHGDSSTHALLDEEVLVVVGEQL
jgi:hypothetical protein